MTMKFRARDRWYFLVLLVPTLMFCSDCRMQKQLQVKAGDSGKCWQEQQIQQEGWCSQRSRGRATSWYLEAKMKRWKALESYRHPGGWKHISDDPIERNPAVRLPVILIFLFIPLLHTDALDWPWSCWPRKPHHILTKTLSYTKH